MKLLVLGGTRFAGRHLVELALSRGHEVTLFHRGQTNPGLFPGAEEVLGDARGGEVLAPGRPDRTVQVVDARDLAAWLLVMAERGRSGLFNVTGPGRKLTMGEVLETCREATESEATLTWVDEPFLLENAVEPFTELPLWLPESEAGFGEIDNRRAVAEGLTFRPLLDTARDTLAWMRAEPEPPLGRSLSPEREAELLHRWRERFC